MKIHVSETTYSCLQAANYLMKQRGSIDIKVLIHFCKLLFQLLIPNYLVILSKRCSTVSIETYPLYSLTYIELTINMYELGLH